MITFGVDIISTMQTSTVLPKLKVQTTKRKEGQLQFSITQRQSYYLLLTIANIAGMNTACPPSPQNKKLRWFFLLIIINLGCQIVLDVAKVSNRIFHHNGHIRTHGKNDSRP